MELEDFQKLKSMLSKVDQKNNQLIGAKESLLESLKDEFKLKSLEDAEKYVKKKKKEIAELTEEVNELKEELIKDLKEEGILENEED